jgi:hypothetical protein
MAYIVEPTEQMREDWGRWLASRPEAVRRAIEENKLEPWKLYRLKSSGHRVVIVSALEHEVGPVTLKVEVSGRFNLLVHERQVFGVALDDLEECDLPSAGEPLGAVLTDGEASAAIEGVDGTEEKLRAVKAAGQAAVDAMVRGPKA